MQAAQPPSHPSAADAAAAHHFLTELRTRIALQSLPYQHGIEARALQSLFELFGHAREAMKKHPGCQLFSARVVELLNLHLRPVTAKWHRGSGQGRLNSRDGADEFRTELAIVQKELRRFALEFQTMAYGSAAPDDLTPEVMSEAVLDVLLADVRFGVMERPGGREKEINDDEAKEVLDRRSNFGIVASPGRSPDDRLNAVGLAFSGGGIRSATFSLGVVQVLAMRKLLPHVDFLSTVSGGGYTGSFVTARIGGGEPQESVAGPYGPDPEPIRHLRLHAKYLAAADLKQRWGMVTSTLAGMLLNWTAPALLVVVAALLAVLVDKWLALRPAWPAWLAGAGCLTAGALVVYGVLMRLGPGPARLGASILGIAFAWALMLGVGWLSAEQVPLWLDGFSLTGISAWVLAALIAAGPAIIRFIPVLENPTVRRMVLKVLLIGAGILVPLIFVLLFHAATAASPIVLVVLVALFAVVAIGVLNINLTAPHRLYRDLLAVPFVANDIPIPLTAINPSQRAPYHLINTAVNLPSSIDPALRERRSDFFIFSKHWCGSPVTGYERTPLWSANNDTPDLATAMAISGAAVSSRMGLASMPTLVALLTFLNVRLGFWVRRPNSEGFPAVPGFMCLLREMTGIGMTGQERFLNLSDGGHIENLGVYELLRRRCKYVICVDGEADPNFTFPGLMTVVRHAQIDLGVRMEPGLGDIRPDPKSGYSQAHATLFRIRYPDRNDGYAAATGLLLYLKLSLTGNESQLVGRYRRISPDFPHELTLDQFFTEEQFEAYRQLGVHVADGLFSPVLMGGPAGCTASDPQDVAGWFRRLARNLLVP